MISSGAQSTATICKKRTEIAGHLFPWERGEDTMQPISGHSDSGHSELFKAENGILWSFEAEERFEAGHFVVVPDVPDQPRTREDGRDRGIANTRAEA